MSQEKVERYKEQKANRKEIMRKQKIQKIITKSVAGVVVVAVLGWLGYSGVLTYIKNIPREQVTVDYKALTDYEQALAESSEEKTDDKAGEKTEEKTEDKAEDAEK